MIRSSIHVPCIFCFSGLRFSRASFGCLHSMCRFPFLRCVLCVAFAVFVFSSFATQEVTITVFRKYDDNTILWGGDGTTAWQVLQLERRGIWLYSYVLLTSGTLSGFTIRIADNDSLKNVCDRLATNPPEDFKYVDWDGDWSGNITPYYPSGHVFYDGDTPTGVVMNNGGEFTTVPLNSFGSGFVSDDVVYQGVTGQWQVAPGNPDVFPGGWYSTFVPNWGGGIENTSSPTTSITPFNPMAGNLPSSSSSTTETQYNYNSVNTTTIQVGGDTYNVVDVPRTDVTMSDSSGNSITIPVYNYSDVLNSMGGVLQSFATQNNQDMATINENLQKMLEIDDSGSLDVAPTDDSEYAADTSEASEVLETVSGWGFNFGMQSNPLGDIFTSILGNPPTSFGSVDRVWDIEIDLGLTSVHSSFSLSDWFPSALRSCILMVITIAFAIAIAKSVSGAFS